MNCKLNYRIGEYSKNENRWNERKKKTMKFRRKIVVGDRHMVWKQDEGGKQRRKKKVGKINQTSKKRNVMSLMGAVIFWMEFSLLFHSTYFFSRPFVVV